MVWSLKLLALRTLHTMVKSEWTKEQSAWIENYKTGVMMPMLADWRTWKLGDPVPVATLPKDWGASVAWPAFVDKFGSNQASNTSFTLVASRANLPFTRTKPSAS